jgi:hypothetical protein
MIDSALFAVSAVATFAYVFLRAFQQINVIHQHYWRILPTSLGMGIGDVVLILLIVKADTLWIGLSNGIAGACGCYAAIYLTRRLK